MMNKAQYVHDARVQENCVQMDSDARERDADAGAGADEDANANVTRTNAGWRLSDWVLKVS